MSTPQQTHRRRRKKHKRVDADDTKQSGVASIGLEISNVLFGLNRNLSQSLQPDASVSSTNGNLLAAEEYVGPTGDATGIDAILGSIAPTDSSSERTTSVSSDDTVASCVDSGASDLSLRSPEGKVVCGDEGTPAHATHPSADDVQKQFKERAHGGYFHPSEWDLSVDHADQMRGVWPNVYWRAVLHDELRTHSRFIALPPVDRVVIESQVSLRFIRQDSVLWDKAHSGLLTTRRLSAVLGFREPKSVRRLSLSRRFINHSDALEACAHLRLPLHYAWTVGADDTVSNARVPSSPIDAPATPASELQPLRRVLHVGNVRSTADYNINKANCSPASSVGVACCPDSVSGHPFGNEGMRLASCTADGAGALYRGPFRGAADVRMAWGRAQEASSILSLLDAHPTSRVIEAGLFVLEPASTDRIDNALALPPLGASPDGILVHDMDDQHTMDEIVSQLLVHTTGAPSLPSSTGARSVRMEVVEVKNVCPFVDAPSASEEKQKQQSAQESKKRKKKKTKTGGDGRGISGMTIDELMGSPGSPVSRGAPPSARGRAVFARKDLGPHEHVAPQFVPQLQLEMLVTGAEVANLVSCSATKGTNIFRVCRDDAYIASMLRYISRFYTAFVCTGIDPPDDFFFDDKDYKLFLDRTVAISNSTPVHTHVADVLRVWRGSKFFLA